MSSVAPFVTQMLRQQAAAEEQRRMVKDAVAGQAASSIMRQIAMGEIQQEMAREARTGRALEAAAGAESRRSVAKSRLEAQKELDEKQKLLGLIGGAADATGALGAYFIEKNATDKAQAEAAFQKRMDLSAMNPQVDDMSQFNPEDIEALQAMSKAQTRADADAMVFDPAKVPSEEAIAAAVSRPDDSFPRDAGMYEIDTIRGMIDPMRGPGITGMPLTPEEQAEKEIKDRRVRNQLRAIRRFQGNVGSAPSNPFLE